MNGNSLEGELVTIPLAKRLGSSALSVVSHRASCDQRGASEALVQQKQNKNGYDEDCPKVQQEEQLRPLRSITKPAKDQDDAGRHRDSYLGDPGWLL